MNVCRSQEFEVVKSVIEIKKIHIRELRELTVSHFISEEILSVEESLLKFYAKAYFEYDKGDAAFGQNWLSLVSWDEILFILNCGGFIATAIRLKFTIDSLFKTKEKIISKNLKKICTTKYAKRFLTAIQILRFYYELFNNYSNKYPVIRLENIYFRMNPSLDSSEEPRISMDSEKRASIYYSKTSENTSQASDKGTSESSIKDYPSSRLHRLDLYHGTTGEVCCVCSVPLDLGHKCLLCGELFHKACCKSKFRICKKRKSQCESRPLTALEFITIQQVGKGRSESYCTDNHSFTDDKTLNSAADSSKNEGVLGLNHEVPERELMLLPKKENASKRQKTDESIPPRTDDSEIVDKKSAVFFEEVENVSQFDTIFKRINAQEASKALPRRLKNALKSKPSVIADWIVPMEAVTFGEVIKETRFGKNKKGRWHGDVSVIILENTNMNHEEEAAFKQKVFQLKRTRHTNLGLFMGAFLESPVYGIITSLNQGDSLYDVLKENNVSVDYHYGISIIQQTAQGLGYLHFRGIIHNNLNSKTVVLEGSTVKLTEFGLVTKENQINYIKIFHNRLVLPRYWLAYQPPEVLALLSFTDRGCEFGALSDKSDIYYLGIMWKEILDKNFMIGTDSPECLIYQLCSSIYMDEDPIVGNVKLVETITACLKFNPEERPSSGSLIEMLQFIPKARVVTKAPSAPTKISV